MGLEDTQQHEHEPVTQPKEPAPTVVRKKFAKPPVKVACLAW